MEKIAIIIILFTNAVIIKRSIVLYLGENTPHILLGFPLAASEYFPQNISKLRCGFLAVNHQYATLNIIILSIILFGAFYPFIQKSDIHSRRMKILQHILFVFISIVTTVNLLLSFNIFYNNIYKFNVVLLFLWLCITILSIYRLCNWYIASNHVK